MGAVRLLVAIALAGNLLAPATVVAQEGIEAITSDGTMTPECFATEETDVLTEECVEDEPVELPPPVAEYWTEWAEHKFASRGRVEEVLNNTKNARGKKRVKFYKEAIGIHADELAWLGNRRPDACYVDEHGSWRGAVEDLHKIQQTGLRAARGGNQKGLRRAAKARQKAVRQLDEVMSSVADCGPSAPVDDAASVEGDPLVGKWKGRDNWVMPDGFHNNSKLTLTIDDDGRYVFRDSNGGACRNAGHGYVPWTQSGSGWFDEQVGVRRHASDPHPAYCHPRGKRGRQYMGDHGRETRYDASADVLYGWYGGCSWRAGAGGRTDCDAFWRGETPERLLNSDDAVASSLADSQ